MKDPLCYRVLTGDLLCPDYKAEASRVRRDEYEGVGVTVGQ